MKRALVILDRWLRNYVRRWGIISALVPKFVERLVVEYRLLTAD